MAGRLRISHPTRLLSRHEGKLDRYRPATVIKQRQKADHKVTFKESNESEYHQGRSPDPSLAEQAGEAIKNKVRQLYQFLKEANQLRMRPDQNRTSHALAIAKLHYFVSIQG